jgi:hypothetical protein
VGTRSEGLRDSAKQLGGRYRTVIYITVRVILKVDFISEMIVIDCLIYGVEAVFMPPGLVLSLCTWCIPIREMWTDFWMLYIPSMEGVLYQKLIM